MSQRTRGFNSRPECSGVLLVNKFDLTESKRTNRDSVQLASQKKSQQPRPNGGTGIHATLKMSSPWDESSNLSLATTFDSVFVSLETAERKLYCRRAGSQLAFIRPIRSVQFRSLQLKQAARWQERMLRVLKLSVMSPGHKTDLT